MAHKKGMDPRVFRFRRRMEQTAEEALLRDAIEQADTNDQPTTSSGCMRPRVRKVWP